MKIFFRLYFTKYTVHYYIHCAYHNKATAIRNKGEDDLEPFDML